MINPPPAAAAAVPGTIAAFMPDGDTPTQPS